MVPLPFARGSFLQEQAIPSKLDCHIGPAPSVVDEDHTAPLTDSSRLRPSIAEVRGTPTGQRHDRQRSRAGSALNGLSVFVGSRRLIVLPSRNLRHVAKSHNDIDSMKSKMTATTGITVSCSRHGYVMYSIWLQSQSGVGEPGK